MLLNIYVSFLALELLRSQTDRGNFIVAKDAKIVAMTCTHAALKRQEVRKGEITIVFYDLW